MHDTGREWRALTLLLEAGHSCAPVELVGVVEDAAAELGATWVRVLLIDFGQELLTPLLAAGEPIPVLGTLPGRAYTSGAPVVVRAESGGVLVATPLLDGVERVGVLELQFPDVDEDRLDACRRFSDLVTQLIASKDRYTDELHVARAREALSLAAQMQWQALPPLVAHTPVVTIAGQVEPAYHVGGDAFDYAVNGSTAHVAVFDAMGHGIPASVVTALAMGAYRNCRRRRAGLADTLTELHSVLEQEFSDDRYVTAVLGELDLESGVLRVVSAGHPAPLLVRGRRVVSALEVEPVTPLGMSLGLPPVTPAVRETALEPGDRVLFVTDGIIDAQDAAGRRFGEERLAHLVERAALDEMPLPELARGISRGVFAFQHGELVDDASLLLLEYHGGSGKRPEAGVQPRPGPA